MKKIIFFIGNGFNYYLLSKIKEHNLLDEKGIKQVHNIINLWHKFDFYFKEVKEYFLNIDSKLTDEEILQQIYNSFDLIYLLNQSKIIKSKTCDECINSTKENIQKNIYDMLNNIVEEYIDNLEVTYKIDDTLEDISQFNVLDNIDFSIVTTNYDNLVDEFFRIRKYKLLDGFNLRSCNSSEYKTLNYVCFDSDNLNIKNNKVIHLHGSLMFFERKNKFIKFKRNSLDSKSYSDLLSRGFNNNIVFNVPNLKNKIINQSQVLSKYLKYIEKIEEDKYIFIVGLSLKSDPHISDRLIDIIEDRFNKNIDIKVIIYDKYPNKIVEQLLLNSKIEKEDDKSEFLKLLSENLFCSEELGLLTCIQKIVDLD